MESFVVAALSGVAIGIFSGLLGIGGGTLMVPFFRLGFGLSALEATATSLFTIIPTSLAGCVGHLKNKTCVPKLGLSAGIAGACTAPVGVLCASCSPAWLIMLAAAAIIVYSAFTMFRKALRMSGASFVKRSAAQAPQRREGEKTAADQADKRPGNQASISDAQLDEQSGFLQLSGKQLALGALIGLAAGFASGYVGVGGGFIMVPLFISILGVSMKRASGTSLIAVLFLALSGTVEQAFLGNINYLCGIAMALGSIPGAFLGARLVRFVPERALRFAFAFFLLVAAVALAGNEFLPLVMS